MKGASFHQIQFRSSDLKYMNTFLVIQWLRLCAPSAGGSGSIPSQGTRFHMLQLSTRAAATEPVHSRARGWQ